MPPSRTVLPPSLNSMATCFDCVSLVRMASAACAAAAWVGWSCPATAAMPLRMFGIGNGTPIRPVEPTSTSVVFRPSAWPVSAAISSASAKPCGPVQALALPELMTTAHAVLLRRCSTQSFTGAAQIWFVVNIPAALAGTSETISARSCFWPLSLPLPVPSVLTLQNRAAARKPSGAVIDPLIFLNLAMA